jgi:hypothetical protein
MSETERVDSVETYGVTAAVTGYIFAGLLIWFMFALADGFS